MPKKVKTEAYFKIEKCESCKGKGFWTMPKMECAYCKGVGKKKYYYPHPSHKMTKFYSEIIAPCGTPRFYAVRKCKVCLKEEWRHAAGHFFHGLTFPCKGEVDPEWSDL